jgi:DNA-directed RNA polymerase specialized sigma24 family protein
VAALPARYKTIVLLYHVECLSYGQIAKRLKVPVGTIKSRLYRARVALRRMLQVNASMLGAGSAIQDAFDEPSDPAST